MKKISATTLLTATLLLGSALNASAEINTDWSDADFTAGDYTRTVPEGELRTYMRHGKYYQATFEGVICDTQAGRMQKIIVEDDGVTVWINAPVSGDRMNLWVKGEMIDGIITIPEGTTPYHNDYDDGTFSHNVLVNVAVNENPDPEDSYTNFTCIRGDIRYAFDGENLTLLPNDSGIAAIGLMRYTNDPESIEWGMNFKWMGYADEGTKYTPFTDEICAGPSEGIPVETYTLLHRNNPDGMLSSQSVGVAIEGENIYLGKMHYLITDAWVKGTLKDGKATFPAAQFVGVDEGSSYNMAMYMRSGTAGVPSADDITFTDGIVFDFDTETHTLTAANPNSAFILNAGTEELMYTYLWMNMTIAPWEDVAMTPANPIVGGEYSFDTEWDTAEITIALHCADVNDKALAPDLLSYQVFINGEPFVFTSTDYTFIHDDMPEIPYLYSDGWEVNMEYNGLWRVKFYGPEPESIGVQAIYRGGNEERRSDIVTFQPTSVDQIGTDKAIDAVEYYTPAGTRVNADYRGIVIKVTRYTDGTTDTAKTILR